MKNYFEKVSKITLSVFILILISLSPLSAKKASAQWAVFDPANFANTLANMLKDYGLDALAWQISNLVVDRITASTVNWINSGFEGSPAYVTNPGEYFQDIGDKVAGQYIFNNPNLNFLCGPISARIKLTLAQNYIRDNVRWQCTLTDVKGNVDDFMGDFERGGWDKFFELTQRQQNNPIGAFFQAENELNIQLANRRSQKNLELSWGRGFMSSSECVRYGAEYTRTVQEPGSFVLVGGTNIYVPGETKQVTEPGPCLEERTSTPGSVVQEKLNNVLNLGEGKLTVADELNEIVSALLNQVTSQVVGGIGRGLRGLSQPNSSGGGAFTNQLASSTSSTDYFGGTANTSVLEQEPPNPYEGQPASSTIIWPTEGSSGQPFTP